MANDADTLADTGASELPCQSLHAHSGLLTLTPKQFLWSANSFKRSESRSIPEAAPLKLPENRTVSSRPKMFQRRRAASAKHSREVVDHDGKNRLVEDFLEEATDSLAVLAHSK